MKLTQEVTADTPEKTFSPTLVRLGSGDSDRVGDHTGSV
jgi:hypothetical protein